MLKPILQIGRVFCKKAKYSRHHQFRWCWFMVFLLTCFIILTTNALRTFMLWISCRSKACHIPKLEELGIIPSYLIKEDFFDCNVGFPQLVASNSTWIYKTNHPYINTSMLQCCYIPFKRIAPTSFERGISYKYQNKCSHFEEAAEIKNEFIKVECKYEGTKMYEDYFAFVPRKKYIKVFNNTENRREMPLNVLVIGIESMSRLNFLRQMPLTADFLLQNLSAVEFIGYNKVASGKISNLIPAFTGASLKQLKCIRYPLEYFDFCPFIWDKYYESGFATSFAEDRHRHGLFNLNYNGFYGQPTNYWWGTFCVAAETYFGKVVKGREFCLGNKPQHRALLEYTSNFVSKMKEYRTPFFGIFWSSSLSRDYFNLPQVGDRDYRDFFANLLSSNILEQTFIIFLSDQGFRDKNFARTFQGAMEERLPFLYIVTPEWYKMEYIHATNNLKLHSIHLTTPYDVYATLVDLLDPYKLTKEFLQNRSTYAYCRKSYSLFDGPCRYRTCENAGIEPAWCTCKEFCANF